MNITNKKIIAKNILYPVLGLVLFFLVWAIAAAVYNKPLALASPLSTLKAMLELIPTSNFWLRIFSSLMRAVIAYLISFVLALAVALLCTVFDIKKILSPVITIVRAVPTVTVIMLIFLWTNPKVTPVVVAILVVFPVIFSSFAITLSGVNKDLMETAKVFGCGRLGLMRVVYLPSLKKSVVENSASGLSLGFKLVISVEIMFPVKDSIGAFIKSAEQASQTANFFAAALVVAILCIVIEIFIRLPLSRPYFAD